MRRLTRTKERGLRKRTSASSHTSKPMAKVVGDLSPKPQVYIYMYNIVYIFTHVLFFGQKKSITYHLLRKRSAWFNFSFFKKNKWVIRSRVLRKKIVYL